VQLAPLDYVRRKLAWLLFALPLAACGPRSDRAGSIWQKPAATAPAATETVVAEKQPTGDPALKNAAVALGKAPPEIHASEWVNTSDPLSLRDLNGRPVLISFCRIGSQACEESRAVLRDLHEQHQKWGFTIIELFIDQPSGHLSAHEHWQHLRATINAIGLPYAAGFGERVTYTQLRYGFDDTPAAYLVDSDGKLVWSGSPKAHEASLRAAAETIAGRAPI
jgi:hypothetical protein